VDIFAQPSGFDDELLAELDVVVASCTFRHNEAENTKRLIRAAGEQICPHHGQLTGRLCWSASRIRFNAQAVIDACAGTGTWIELNCNPHRLT